MPLAVAFKLAGIEFIDENGGGPGVRLRKRLGRTVADVVGYQGEILFDTSRPDGMPHKLLDTYKLTKLG